MRSLQAQLISERVFRDLAEKKVGEKESRVRKLENEYRDAVGALRRSRNESQKTEEEKAAIIRTYEMTKNRSVMKGLDVLRPGCTSTMRSCRCGMRGLLGRRKVVLR